MSGRSRLAFVAVAIVLAAVAFVVLRPEDDDAGSGTTAATAPAATAPADTAPGGTETAPAPRRPRVPTIRVRGGQPVGGVRELRAESGERVRFRVVVDSPQQIHLHGYDVYRQAEPGSPATFSVDAELEGIFEVELEGAHVQIAELRVEP